jgi:WD40 repeat protein
LFALVSPSPVLDRMVTAAVALTPPPVATLRHAEQVFAVAFSPDGKRLASGGIDRVVKIWDTKNWQELATFRDPTGGILAVAFSPDGRRIATGGSDSTVKLWDAGSGALVHMFYGHTHWVYDVAFSPDGRTLASGSLDGTVKLWPASPPEPPG